MNQPTRLFDCLEYQLERYPLDTMMAAKESGQWKSYSTAETQSLVNKFSAGLQALGIGGGDYSVEGRDKISLSERYGGTGTDHLVTEVLSGDSGIWILKVR